MIASIGKCHSCGIQIGKQPPEEITNYFTCAGCLKVGHEPVPGGACGKCKKTFNEVFGADLFKIEEQR